MSARRILVVSSGGLMRGGVENFLYNWFFYASKEEYSFTWYFPCDIIDKVYAEKFVQLGTRLISGGIPLETNNIVKARRVWKDLKKLLQEETFDIIHVSTGSVSANAIALWHGKRNGIKIRIAHSHSSGASAGSFVKKIVLTFLRFAINRCASVRVACSYGAAVALFGKKNAKKTIIIHNCIDTSKFAFSNEARERCRNEFKIQDRFVMGQVARLSPEKNQKFLIDIFENVYKMDRSSVLLFVGSGPEEGSLKNYAKQKKLNDVVIFAGATSVPQSFYCAMDVFVLTSFFEGFGIVNIEAQANGLPCVVSDVVPTEGKVSDDFLLIPLEKSAKEWADIIIDIKRNEKKTEEREKALQNIVDAGFDISKIETQIKLLYK